ncbi:nucleotide exchange factor GrpE [Desulfovirgula thermocuniculi]|uniref:nucleotide exchange factor GrpE n=1 Tax=Desulfovirgula thermocuniculi TaxID=348842 RepID=UPI000422EC5A|nr:nucleotide exchange factor GrpE [Desulfovirgula thermocuniculi]
MEERRELPVPEPGAVGEEEAATRAPEPEEPAARSPAEPAAGPEAEPKQPPADLAARVEELEKRLAEQAALAEAYFHRLARVQADFENFRRRVNREREEWLRYASMPLVEALLPVMDNFERALAAKDEDPAQVVAGIEMIYRQLKEILEKEGLAPVPALNEPFDPQKHEVLMREETDAYPDNTVIAELRRGYYYKDRLLRPALVKVARAVSRPGAGLEAGQEDGQNSGNGKEVEN